MRSRSVLTGRSKAKTIGYEWYEQPRECRDDRKRRIFPGCGHPLDHAHSSTEQTTLRRWPSSESRPPRYDKNGESMPMVHAGQLYEPEFA